MWCKTSLPCEKELYQKILLITSDWKSQRGWVWRPNLACIKTPVSFAEGAPITSTLEGKSQRSPRSCLLAPCTQSCFVPSAPCPPSPLPFTNTLITAFWLRPLFCACTGRSGLMDHIPDTSTEWSLLTKPSSICSLQEDFHLLQLWPRYGFAADMWIQTQIGSQSNPSGMCPAPVNIKHLWRYLCISPGWEEPAAFFS